MSLSRISDEASRPWGERAHTRTTWYEPLEESADIAAALGWAFAVRGDFVNSAGDLDLLPQVLEAAAASPERPSDEYMSALAVRVGMEVLFA